jgi:hypothetical protein
MERAQVSDVENLYVHGSHGSQNVADKRIRRQEHFRKIGVHAFINREFCRQRS